MKQDIKEGDIVVYYTNRRLELGKVSRIDKWLNYYHIVPLTKSSYIKKRKYSELLSLEKIQSIIKQ